MAASKPSAEQLITNNIDVWTSAIKKRGSQGRGSSKKIELYGIKKLRELILELAVRGLLVPQDPNDEPASLLLEKIAAEKEQLIKDGKVKKQKPLPEIAEEEKPFDLPNGWEWVRFQDISEYIQRGKGPKYAESGKVRVVSQKCVQAKGFTLDPAKYVEDSSLEKYQPERFLKSNDLLWNSTGTGTVGRINVITDIEPNTLVADSHVTVIRTLLVNTGFIWSYISAPGIQSRIEPTHENALVSGSTKQVELNTSSVINIIVPIPPEDEQPRIFARVNELMALCDQLEQQAETSLTAHQTLVETLLNTLLSAAQTTPTNSSQESSFDQAWNRIAQHFDVLFTTEHSIDLLKQTILQLAVMGKLVPQDPNDEPASVLLEKIAAEKEQLIKDKKIKKQKALPLISDDEKPFELPVGWEWCRLSDVIDVRDGTHDSPKDALGKDTYPLITSKNFNNGEINFNDARRISKDDHLEISKRSLVEVDDILFSMIGGNLGNQVIVKDPRSFSIKNVALLKYYLKNATQPEYIKIFTEELAIELQNKASGGAQPFVSLGALRKLVFAFPPFDEQTRIRIKATSLIALCDSVKELIGESQLTQLHLADAMAEEALI